VFPLKDDNPTHSVPIVTIGLIVANALVFFYQVSLEVPVGLRLSPVNVVCDFGAGAPGGFGLMYIVQ